MIICAAIQLQYQRNGNTIKTVVPGLRHSNCHELMADLGVPSNRNEIEGFIDNKGNFLDRYDAFCHALECGQLSDTVRVYKAERGERQLFSEDLY